MTACAAGRLAGGVGHVIAVKGEGEPLGILGRVGIVLFQIPEGIEGQQGGVGAFFHEAVASAGQAGEQGLGQEQAFRLQRAAAAHGGGQGLAQDSGRELLSLAQTDGKDARHVLLGVAVQQDEFILFAAKVARGGRDGQPRGGLVQQGAGLVQVFPLEGGGKQNLGLPVIRAEALKTQFHIFTP